MNDLALEGQWEWSSGAAVGHVSWAPGQPDDGGGNEDCGLVSPRRVGSARVYGERERVRIKLILRGKRLGLSLAEIGELLDLYEVARNERAQLSKFLAILGERRGRLLQQKEDIDATLAEIEGLERECRRRLKDQEARARVATPPAAGD